MNFDQFYLLLLFTTSPRLETFLEGLIEDELVQDALVSQSVEQEKDLWTIREDLPVCLMQRSRSSAKTEAHADVHAHAGVIEHADLDAGVDTGASIDPGGGADVDVDVSTQCIKLYKYDVSLSLRDTEAMVLQVKKEVSKVIRGTAGHSDFPTGLNLEFCCFGHAGDQNLHLNILLHVPSIYALELREDLKNSIQILLNNAVFKAVLSLHGSVSAEHGVGQQKREIMNLARTPAELVLMASIKRTLDPNGILNPGKVLPDGH
jgi:FAD/FMN-containing dehydrogenase